MAEPAHGTSNRYKNLGCRCDPCSDAGREWMRDYYRRTHGLTKMIRTGKAMERGSQGGVNNGDGSVRGPQINVTRRMPHKVEARRAKPKVMDYEPDDSQ